MKYVMKKVEENKLQKKNALLQSSFDLFLNHGFSKTTISDISKRAGLAKGTFYLYFKDKYDIRDKLIMYKAGQLLEDAHLEISSRPKAESFEAIVLDICDYIIHRFEEDPKLLHFISKNLSWGIFKNILEQDVVDESIPFIDYIKDVLSEYSANCDTLNLMLFTIIELLGSTCHSCIIYKQPVSMEEYLPYLHETILSILRLHIKYD